MSPNKPVLSPLESQAARFGDSYRWLATFTIMLGTIATTATATIVNVAMHDIMGAFGMGQDQAQWLSTAFLASMTATMLVTAWTLERFGYRATYVGALVIFVLGSLLGTFSQSSAEVIIARILQGGASGIIQPLAMIIISQVFPVSERGKAMGIYGVGVVLAPALGPAAGGLMVDSLDWRAVFMVVVPFCLAGIAAAVVILPAKSPHRAGATHQFDTAGFILLVIALTALLAGLSNGQRTGWDSLFIISLLAVAVITMLLFILREFTTPHPLLNLRVFANPAFTSGCIVAFALGAGIYGSTYIIPLFVQSIQGYTPTRSGLLLMPAGLALGMVFPLAGSLSDKLRPHTLVMIGLLLFGLSCWLSSEADTDTPFWTMAWWIVIGRVGLGLMLPAMNAGALRALPPHQLAQGAGSLNFVRQLGGAMGVNLLSVFIERRTTFHGQMLSQALMLDNTRSPDAIRQLGLLFGHAGNPLGDPLSTSINPGIMTYLLSVLTPKAQMFAYQDGFFVVALFFFFAMLPAWFIRPRPVLNPTDTASRTQGS
ncbi:DHA2 family efflux MFS transporter permease subunit [Dickeya lacustris]|uniref:DHA2 family efflux MFS transporter permease subunit n=1 Tax=Dickeya lacustris TaxID=2259638 RepID=A0ABY8GAZ1_9GAMM|nr:DHA2 family efflux MFS transporter permease subunit [Dickeya lacustris]WFN57154.1 DHA2 family efflux MFS transporter permease subunit [Dickeya lacustris]